MMVDRRFLQTQAPRSGKQRSRDIRARPGFAQGRAALHAWNAASAGWHERKHHLIARFQVCHEGATFLNFPGSFVA
jgi:hypothetical protein